MAKRKHRVGLWLIGACGGIGSTVAMGVAALRKSRASTTGLVSAMPQFGSLGLVDPGGLVVGGHELRDQSLVDAVNEANQVGGLFSSDLIKSCTPLLRQMQVNIRPGTAYGAREGLTGVLGIKEPVGSKRPAPPTPQKVVKRLTRDLKDFASRNRLDHVVVAHVASAEPDVKAHPAQKRIETLREVMQSQQANVLAASSLYAMAAIEAGCSYINFTTSIGIDVPALIELAEQRGIGYMGRDGKTGETLVKTTLAPMFAMRNLAIKSWVGHNILGNRDGAVLADPQTKLTKIASKSTNVDRIVGYPVDSHVSIEYVKSLHDWKVAWDFIHFEGFLGTKMSMQFTWQGSDSLLAAPLVIDLARFAEHQHRTGGRGRMAHLACFFKRPMGVPQEDLFLQWTMLMDYVHRHDTTDKHA